MTILPFPLRRYTRLRMSATEAGNLQRLLAADAQREIYINRALQAMVTAGAGGDTPGAYAAQTLMISLIEGRSARAVWRERGLVRS